MAKKPPLATRVRKRPKADASKPPHATMDPIRYSILGPFVANDVPGLAARLGEGLKLASDANHADLAGMLNKTFRKAFTTSEAARQQAANNELMEFYSAVARDARQLLNRLGIQDKSGLPALELDELAPWFEHMLYGLHSMPKLPWWLNRQERAGPFTKADWAAAREVGRTSLLKVPALLDLLEQAALAGGDAIKKRPKRRGARPNYFQSDLFAELAKAHWAMFGVWPKLRDTEGERKGPSGLWLVRVLKLAAQRMVEQGNPMAPDVQAISRLARDTLAARMGKVVMIMRRNPRNYDAVT